MELSDGRTLAEEIFLRHSGRIIIATFASNIYRVKWLIKGYDETNNLIEPMVFYTNILS